MTLGQLSAGRQARHGGARSARGQDEMSEKPKILFVLLSAPPSVPMPLKEGRLEVLRAVSTAQAARGGVQLLLRCMTCAVILLN